MTPLLTMLLVVANPNETDRVSFPDPKTRLVNKTNSPEGVASGDAGPEGTGEVEPETLPQLSGDRCDGHLVVGVC